VIKIIFGFRQVIWRLSGCASASQTATNRTSPLVTASGPIGGANTDLSSNILTRDLRLVVTVTTAASVLPAKTPGTLHF